MKHSEKDSSLLIGVMAAYFVTNATLIVNPPMEAFATQLYPEIPYGTVLLISTLASLFMIPGSLLSGAVSGKQIGFKKMCVLAIAAMTLSGILPFFIRSFPFVLVMRMITGFSIGLVFPLQSTLAIRLFNEGRRPFVLGLGSFFMAASGILFQTLSGAVSTRQAADSWLVHGLLVVPLVCAVLFLKEPPKEQAPSAAAGNSPADTHPKVLPAMVFFTASMFSLIFLAFYPALLNMAAILSDESIGTAATAGIISSIYTIGGAVAGLFFSKIWNTARRFTIPLGLILWTLGTGLFCLARTVPVMAVAIFIAGLAVQIVWPATMNRYSEYVPSKQLGMASALFLSGMNLGCFFSSFYISLVGSITGNQSPRFPSIIGFWMIVICSAVWTAVEIAAKTKTRRNIK